MTGRTHDLAAFTAISYIVATQPLIHVGLPTAVVALTSNFIGGLAPDIDQPTGNLWHRLPAGTLFGRLLSPLLGGHRFISHSIFGIFLFGFLFGKLLEITSPFLIVDQGIVWWGFMIGYISHLIMDTFTKEGVPWLFPAPIKFGIPPLHFLRVTTGGNIEKYVVFPMLLFVNGYLFYTYYPKFLELIKSYIH